MIDKIIRKEKRPKVLRLLFMELYKSILPLHRIFLIDTIVGAYIEVMYKSIYQWNEEKIIALLDSNKEWNWLDRAHPTLIDLLCRGATTSGSPEIKRQLRSMYYDNSFIS
jgi:hypothetical protein